MGLQFTSGGALLLWVPVVSKQRGGSSARGPRPFWSGPPHFPASVLTLLSPANRHESLRSKARLPLGGRRPSLVTNLMSKPSSGHHSQTEEGSWTGRDLPPWMRRRGQCLPHLQTQHSWRRAQLGWVPLWAHPASCVSDLHVTLEPLLPLPRQTARTHASAEVFSTLRLQLWGPRPSQSPPSHSHCGVKGAQPFCLLGTLLSGWLSCRKFCYLR